MQFAQDYIDRLRGVLAEVPVAAVGKVIEIFRTARDRDRRIFIVGNGGSAATASHFAVDLGKGGSLGKPKRFKVLSLTDNLPWITALANDIAYEQVFEQQLRNFAEPGDVLLAISASGNSPNVVNAVKAAKEIGMVTLGWSGFGGGKIASIVDHAIVAADSHYGRVEDVHMVLMHVVCYAFMEARI